MRLRSRAVRSLSLALVVILGTTVASTAAGAQIREDEIQIVELDNSAYPDIEVIVDVPQSFSDQVLTTRDFVLEEGGVTRQLGVEKLAGEHRCRVGDRHVGLDAWRPAGGRESSLRSPSWLAYPSRTLSR